MIIKELSVFDRPMERLKTLGKEELSNGELLAIVIGSGTRDKSAKILAEEVLSMDEKGLLYLQECTVEELSTLKGIGLAKASRIVASLELGRRLSCIPREAKPIVLGTDDVVSMFMEKLRYEKREFFITLMMDVKGALIGMETVAVGDISTSIVHPRETFKSAIKKSAYGVIFIHNHPSGDPTPSKEDVKTTKRLKEAGKLLGIKIFDHVIIGDGVFSSLKALGMI